MRKASHFAPLGGGRVRCALCPHACALEEGAAGACRARRNIGGSLYSLSYGALTSLAVDPVEKKPLYHFYPGRSILSAGSFGCTLSCRFCQNWEISQAGEGETAARRAGTGELLRLARENGSVGMAYTYNEPLANFEWVRDTARAFSEAGLKNVLVTNGYLNPGPWEELLEVVDAANIDVKAFGGDFYRRLCGGRLGPVKACVEAMVGRKKHVELTMLLVPGENDAPEFLEGFVDWVAGLDPSIPVHFSRYFPRYRFTAPPTGGETLERAWRLARKKLKFVYLGNVSGKEFGRTLCPSCGETLIEREGYEVAVRALSRGACARCGEKIPVVL